MIKNFLLLFIFIFYSQIIMASPSLDELSSIVLKAPSVRSFIYDKTLVNDYYLVLNEYYQKKIIREEFDRTIMQIKYLGERIPEFYERLVKSPDFTSYSIQLDYKSYGRDIRPMRFTKFIEEEKSKWKQISNEFPSMIEALSYLKDLQDLELEMLDSLIYLSDKEKKKTRIKFYSEIGQNPKVKSALAKLVLDAEWELGLFSEIIYSKDADFVISEINEILPMKIIDHFSLPSFFKAHVKKLFPTTDQLLSREDIFPHLMKETHEGEMIKVGVTKKGEYLFRAYSMPIHSLWKNFCSNECVRDNPKRWAIALLSNVHSYAIERNGHYIGFLQEVGVKRSGKGIVYATELGSELFRNSVFFKTGKVFQKMTFFDLWLMQVQNDYVRVKSEADLINGAGGTSEFVHFASLNNLKVKLGVNSDYHLTDQNFTHKIIEFSNNEISKKDLGIISNETDQMTFELNGDKAYASMKVYPLFIANNDKLKNIKESAREKVQYNKRPVPVASLVCSSLMNRFIGPRD